MRSRKAYSLVLVMSIGSIAMMTALALTTTMTDGYRFTSKEQYEAHALHDAEIAARYAISVMNSNLTNIPSSVKLPNELAKTASDPRIEKISPTYLQGTPFTPTGIDQKPNNPNTPIIIFDRNNFYCISSDATIGNIKKSIKIIVGLSNQSTATISSSSTASYGPPLTANFGRALSANNKLQVKGVNVIDPNKGQNPVSLGGQADISSNNNLTVTEAKIEGSVNAYGQASEESTASLENATINGDLKYSGKQPDKTVRENQPKDDNSIVLGDGKDDGSLLGKITQNATRTEISPVPIIDVNATVSFESSTPGTTNVSIASSNTTLPAPSPTSVGNLGQMTIGNSSSPSSTINFSSGNYTLPNLTINSNATINVNPNSAVKLFIQGPPTPAHAQSGQQDTAVEFLGKLTNVQDPRDFQIYYSGTKTIRIAPNLDGSIFMGLIYAPNANVEVKLPKGGTFRGAIVANNISLVGKSGNENFEYVNLSGNSVNGGNNQIPNIYVTSSNGSTPIVTNQDFRPISWREY